VDELEACGAPSPWGDGRRCLRLKGHRGDHRGPPDEAALSKLDPLERQVLLAVMDHELERSERDA
jgi:hypothetical protein